ncbi:MAG TPA: hypothetical protein VK610_02565, partial [Rhodothermales bacterium]|nr:hypothetical protein [Rhodothermales bacterium]
MASPPVALRCAALAAALLLSGCEPRPTRATIQGDWVSRTPAGDVDRVFSFRGDSVFRGGAAGTRWQPYRLRGSLLTVPAPEASAFTAAFSADTLVLTLPGQRRVVFVRLPPASEAPRPERITFSRYWCSSDFPPSSCPKFDFEIDSAGTLRVQRHESRDRSTRYVGRGRRALYDRLSTLAAASRADTAHVWMGYLDHGYVVALSLGYGERRQLQAGLRHEYGSLDALISEIERAAQSEPMRPDPTPYLFKTLRLV